MTTTDPSFNLLLAHDDSGQAAVPDGAGTELIDEDEDLGAEAGGPESFRNMSGDWNDLEEQRWGIVLPKGSRGDRLKDLLARLIAHRTEQQGGIPIKEYRVDPVLNHEQAMAWRKRDFDDLSGGDEDIPLYVMVAGDLDEVPVSIDQVLSMDTLVGRLAFDRDDDYASYVEKVIRWELATPKEGGGPLALHSVHDGSGATKAGFAGMVQPMTTLFEDRVAKNKLNASEVLALGDTLGASADDFYDTLDRFTEPGVLFSMSHGNGPPRAGWKTPQRQRDRQGSMSLGTAGAITAGDLVDRDVVPGGVWFMFACFGAGTPGKSVFHHWLSAFNRRPDQDKWAWVKDAIPERPFIAQLPKTVLANPNGPLAFVGHLDLAWTYSFTDEASKQKTPGTYFRTVNDLLQGHRVGIGAQKISDARRAVEGELVDIVDAERAAEVAGLAPAHTLSAKANIWMRRNDLRAYIVLGDPAARMAVRKPARKSATRRPAPAPVVTPVAPPAAPASSKASLPEGVDHDDLLEAIYMALAGDLKAAVDEYSIDKRTLRDLAKVFDRAGRGALGIED